MKKFALASAVAVLAAAVPGAASADAYATLGYTHIDGDGVALGGATGRLGFRAENNFGVEGEATFGINDAEEAGVTFELNQSFGLYGIFFIPAGEGTDFFVRLGYASHEVSGSNGFITVDEDVSGVAGGGGIQHFFGGGNFGMRGEYTRAEGDDGAVDAFTLSGVVKF